MNVRELKARLEAVPDDAELKAEIGPDGMAVTAYVHSSEGSGAYEVLAASTPASFRRTGSVR